MDSILSSDKVKKIAPIPESIKMATECVGRLIIARESGREYVDITDYMQTTTDVKDILTLNGYLVKTKTVMSPDDNQEHTEYTLMCG
jgi:hypothetical protein